MIEIFVTDSEEALKAISSSVEKNVWINGSKTVISTGEDYVAPQEVVTFLDVVAEEVVVKATVVAKKTTKVVPVEVVEPV